MTAIRLVLELDPVQLRDVSQRMLDDYVTDYGDDREQWPADICRTVEQLEAELVDGWAQQLQEDAGDVVLGRELVKTATAEVLS